MNQDIITTIKKTEDEANADILRAQETSRLTITAKEKELSEKLEELEGILTLEIKEIEDRAQRETINTAKKEKENLESTVGKIGRVNFEKAREFILTSLARMFTE